MLLYQGSKFVKGNKFKDDKNNVLTFEKNTKDGRLFVMENGVRAALTESQIEKLELIEGKALGRGLEDLKQDLNLDSAGEGMKALFGSEPLNLDSGEKTVKEILSNMVFDSNDELREFVNRIVDEIIVERK